MTPPETRVEFMECVWRFVHTQAPSWTRRDVSIWLGMAIGNVRYGDPSYCWTCADAEDLGRDFLADTKTW